MTYSLDFSFMADAWPMLLAAAWATVRITAISLFFGFILGTLNALMGLYAPSPLRAIAAVYVETIRNTPLLVQLFIVYFGVASLGFKVSAELSAVIAVAINTGAYTSEIMRAGIESIAKTQWEAAECLGLSRVQTVLKIILPPATASVYPALTSQFILMLLATSVTSQISAEELTAAANVIQSQTFRNVEVYLVVALMYVCLSLAFRGVFHLFGLKFFLARSRPVRDND